MHSYYLYLLRELLAERGIHTREVLAGSGLRELNIPGILGDALMTSANVGQAIDTITRYLQAVLPSLNIDVLNDTDHTSLVVTNQALTPALYRCYTEVLFGAIITSGRLLIGDAASSTYTHLSQVEFNYPTPADLTLHQSVFGQAIAFSSQRCALSFATQSMSIPLTTANHLAQEVFRRECDRVFTSAGKSEPLSKQVMQRLTSAQYEFPSCSTVADQLNMSESTLRRRLAKEKQSFQQLVDLARQQLANQHLQHSDMPVAEIASLLGFSDSANFRRAYKRWTNRTPSQAREAFKNEIGSG